MVIARHARRSRHIGRTMRASASDTLEAEGGPRRPRAWGRARNATALRRRDSLEAGARADEVERRAARTGELAGRWHEAAGLDVSDRRRELGLELVHIAPREGARHGLLRTFEEDVGNLHL